MYISEIVYRLKYYFYIINSYNSGIWEEEDLYTLNRPSQKWKKTVRYKISRETTKVLCP